MGCGRTLYLFEITPLLLFLLSRSLFDFVSFENAILDAGTQEANCIFHYTLDVEFFKFTAGYVFRNVLLKLLNFAKSLTGFKFSILCPLCEPQTKPMRHGSRLPLFLCHRWAFFPTSIHLKEMTSAKLNALKVACQKGSLDHLEAGLCRRRCLHYNQVFSRARGRREEKINVPRF